MQKILKKALMGEIYSNLYHNPTKEEMQLITESIQEFISDLEYDKKKIDLSSLSAAVSYAIKENFLECAECGEKYLRKEMNTDYPDYCWNCRSFYDPENMPGGWEYKQCED